MQGRRFSDHYNSATRLNSRICYPATTAPVEPDRHRKLICGAQRQRAVSHVVRCALLETASCPREPLPPLSSP